MIKHSKLGLRLKRGLTMVELLLGLMIFSLVSVCVYSTFAMGIKLSRYSQERGNHDRERRLALQCMEEELVNAVFYDFTNSDKERIAFAGDKNKVTFFMATDEGLKVVSYYLDEPQKTTIHKTIIGKTHKAGSSIVTRYEETKNVKYLVRQETDFVDYLNGDLNQDDVEVVSTNIQEDGLRFLYGYRKEEDGAELVWQDQWQEKDLPLNVRVEIDFISTKEEKQSATLNKDILIPHGSDGALKV